MQIPFSLAQEFSPLVHLAASPHNETPQPFALSCGPIPKRQKSALCCHAYILGAGILTSFPFGGVLLAPTLGSPKSPLTSVAKKPVCFRCMGFSPIFAVTNTRIFSTARSICPFEHTSSRAARPLTCLSTLGYRYLV